MPYVVFMVATAAQILEALFDGEGGKLFVYHLELHQ